MKKLLLLTMLISTSAFSQSFYPLFCKGGYSLKVARPLITIKFDAAQIPAGETGQSLPPGTCAWGDRTLNEAEPRLIQLDGNYQIDLIRTLFVQGAVNRNCVIRTFVTNRGGYFSFSQYSPDVTLNCYEQ